MPLVEANDDHAVKQEDGTESSVVETTVVVEPLVVRHTSIWALQLEHHIIIIILFIIVILMARGVRPGAIGTVAAPHPAGPWSWFGHQFQGFLQDGVRCSAPWLADGNSGVFLGGG